MSRPGVKRTARKKPKPKPAATSAAAAGAIATRKDAAAKSGAPAREGTGAPKSAVSKGGRTRGSFERARAHNDAAVGRSRSASRTFSPGALRAFAIMLAVGAVTSLVLLGLEIHDAFADHATRPAFFNRDLVSAAESVAMLVIITVVWRIARPRRA